MFKILLCQTSPIAVCVCVCGIDDVSADFSCHYIDE